MTVVHKVCITKIERDNEASSLMFEEEEILVGRSSRCQVLIDKDLHPEVSRMHGKILGENGDWYYEDQGSTHGSFLHGRQIDDKTRLEWGDHIQLGRDGVVLSVTWTLPRHTGMGGTHLRTPTTNYSHFPLAFSQPFFGKYKVYHQIGAGGFGDVWQAISCDETMNVAVKLLRPSLLCLDSMDPVERDELIRRFSREIEVTRVLARSGVPGIVQIHESGEDVNRDFIYVVMDFVDGESMDKLIRRERMLELRRAVQILLPVAQTLAAAHDFSWTDETGLKKHGIVHRDIKPSNIMIDHTTCQSFLVDFGIAAINRGADRLTALDMTIGSVGYMPPEALFTSRSEPSVDLWSFAVTLYVALAAHLPYQGKTISAQYENIKAHNMTPLESWRPDLPGEVVEMINRALHPDPEERIQTADEWVDALRSIT